MRPFSAIFLPDHRRSSSFAVLCLIMLVSFSSFAQGWYNSSWLHRKIITIDYTKVGTGPHTNFPVLVSRTDADLQSKAQADADDILFTSSDGTTKLDHQIESYSSATGAIVAWVRIPSLSSSSNTVVYMYYGNASASSQQNATGAWESNFKAVWHLAETVGGAEALKDATTNGNHGTTQGSPINLGVTSKIAGGVTLDGSNDYISTKSQYTNPQTLTISAWFKTSVAGGKKIFGYELTQTGTGSTSWDRQLWIGADGKLRSGVYDGAVREVATGGTYYNGAWHYAVLTHASNTLKLYVDGASVGSLATSGAEVFNGWFRMGAYKASGWTSGSDGYFNGSIDEARIAFVERSAAWVLTEYNNQNSPATFYTVGSEITQKTWDGGAGTNNWGDANNWNPNGVPVASDFVSLTGANTIDINVAGACSDIVLNNASLVVTVKASQSLTVSGNLTLSGGTLKTENAFPSVSGTVNVGGGTVEYSATSGSQTVAAKSYNNLSVSGGGTKTLAGSITPAGNLTVSSATFDLTTYTCNRASAGGTLTVSNGATLKIGGTGTLPSNYSTHSIGSTSTIEYSGTTQSVATLNSAQDYGNLLISGLGTKTLAGTEGVAGNLTISAGTLLLGSYTLNRSSAGGTLTLASGAALKMGGTNTFPTNYSTHSIGSTSTIEYNGTSQTVGVLNSSQSYGHLTLSGSGTKTLGGTMTVRGTLTLSGATLADGGYTLSAYGDIANSTSHTGAGKIALTGGALAHALSGGGAFTNMEVNDANGATLSTNTTVNGTLTLTSGNITTGSYSLSISSTGTVARTIGHIVGKLQKYTAAGATTKTFEIGTGTDYTPVTVAFASVTMAGNLTASSTASDHANISSATIDASKSVNRTWTLTNSGITFTTCSATFTFAAGDVDAGGSTSAFVVGLYSAGWTYPTVGTRTSTSTQATSLTSFGDFQLGEPESISSQTGSSVSSLTWTHTVPNQNNRILVVGVQTENASAVQPSSITYNGAALTQVGSANAYSTSIYQNVGLWYLLAPSVGTANVVVTWPSTVSSATAGAIVLNGLAQVAPEASVTNYNNAGATTTNITTVSDNSVVVDMFGSGQNQGDLAPGSGQTLRFINAVGATTSGGASTKIVTSAGVTSMSWTQTGINRSAQVVAAFAPAVFYSKGSLAVNTASNWNTKRTGAGTNAPSFGTGVQWIIQNGHSMTLTGSSTWDVSSSGIVEIENGGIWTNSSTGTVTMGTFQIDNGGAYAHGTTNSLPGSSKSFAAASTVSYDGSTQTVQSLAYGHLTISSAGTRTLGGNVTVGGDLTVSGGVLDLSSYTANRSSTGGTITVSNGATLKIGGTNEFPSNYTTHTLGTTGTVEYSGTNQTVSVETYGNLTVSGSGTKTVADDLTVAGNLTIGSSTTFTPGSNIITVQGNFSNSGTFTAGESDVQLTGSSDVAITGATTFYTLTVNKSAATKTITLNNNVTASTLTMTQGKVATGANVITVTTDRTGNGIVIGTVTRTHEFTSGMAYSFEGADNTITFESGETLPTSVTVTTALSSPGENTSMEPIDRYYVISQTGGSAFNYTLRLHYEDAEVGAPNSETVPPLKIWRRTAIGPDVWTREGATSSNTANNWVEQTGLTYTGAFSLSSRTIANMVLSLNQSATNPSPGDQVTYTVNYSNDGDGSSTSTLVTAAAPSNTSYVASSTQVNSVSKTDAADADEVTVSGSTISVNLGTVTVGSSGTITYRVIVN